MENDSVPSMDQPQAADQESLDQLRIFVAVLAVRVLAKCHTLKKQTQEECIVRTRRLINQTMQGLSVTEGFCPDIRSAKSLSKAVVKDVRRQFGVKRLLESTTQDEAVDRAIVKYMQVHIRELSAGPAKKPASPDSWKDVLKLFVIATVTLVSMFILAVLLV